MAAYKPKTSSLLAASAMPPPERPDDDVTISSQVTDTISALHWSPKANWFAASSWDGKMYIFDVARDLTAKTIGVIDAGTPVLGCDWNQDGSIVAGAGADKKVYICSANDGSTMSFEAHDAPVRSVRFVRISGGPADVLATGSWDGTVRYWDVRNTSTPLARLTAKERVYSMDTGGDLLVVGTADRHIHLIDLRIDPTIFMQTTTNEPLSHQTTVVAVMPEGQGYAVGSIEGRVSVRSTENKKKPKPSVQLSNFSFRCHRHEVIDANKNQSSKAGKQTDVYTVNTFSFHPTKAASFATGGSDGGVTFWNGAARHRLYALPRREGAITAAGFNSGGEVFAYAVGYDWSRGCNGSSPANPLQLMLHRVDENKLK